MQLKTLTVLLGYLAYAGQASPLATPEAQVEETRSLEQRGSTGVWLDLFHEGNCNSGKLPEPESGWVWSGQCKNFDSHTYGAKLGTYDPNWPGVEWPNTCILKFWENANCHGKATVHRVADTGDWHSVGNQFDIKKYWCFATANKASGEFYLQNGAASVSMSC